MVESFDVSRLQTIPVVPVLLVPGYRCHNDLSPEVDTTGAQHPAIYSLTNEPDDQRVHEHSNRVKR